MKIHRGGVTSPNIDPSIIDLYFNFNELIVKRGVLMLDVRLLG